MPATFVSICSAREQPPLLRLAARIADQAGAAADDRDRRVTESLQPRESHDGQQRADVQAGRGRIEADVAGHRPGSQRVAQRLGLVVEHPAPFEFGVESMHDARGAVVLYRETACDDRCRDGPSDNFVRRPSFPAARANIAADARARIAAASAARSPEGVAAAGIGVRARAPPRTGSCTSDSSVELTRETLAVVGPAGGLAGLRIGFLTDLHRSDTVSHEMVDRRGAAAHAGAPRI